MNEIFVVVTHTKGSNSSAGGYFYKNKELAEKRAAQLLDSMKAIIDSAEVVSLFDYDG